MKTAGIPRAVIVGICVAIIGIKVAGAQTDVAVPQSQIVWRTLSSGVTSTIAEVSMTSLDTIYALTKSTILQSTNGGAAWSAFAQPLYGDVAFSSSRDGMIAESMTDRIFVTHDSGRTWDTGSSGLTGRKVLKLVSKDSAFILTADQVSRSTDGGRTWRVINTTAAELKAIDFASARYGVAVGAPQYGPLVQMYGAGCYTTTDGGEHWIQHYLPTPVAGGGSAGMLAVTCLDSKTFVAVGESWSVFRTSDGGENWVRMDSGHASIPLYAIASFHSTLFAVGEKGTVTASFDSGLTWRVQQVPVNVTLWSVDVLDDSTVIASGAEGTIIVTRNAGQSWVAVPKREQQDLKVGVYPNPVGSIVHFTYDPPWESNFTVTLSDIAGRQVRALCENEPQMGHIERRYDLSTLPPGTYIYTLSSDGFRAVGKCVHY